MQDTLHRQSPLANQVLSVHACNEKYCDTQVGLSNIGHNDIDSLFLRKLPQTLENVNAPGGTRSTREVGNTNKDMHIRFC